MEHNYKRMPEINTDLCSGCGACVAVCGPGSLQMIEGVAELVNADLCTSDQACLAPCPEHAIRMVWLPFEGDRGIGHWR